MEIEISHVGFDTVSFILEGWKYWLKGTCVKIVALNIL